MRKTKIVIEGIDPKPREIILARCVNDDLFHARDIHKMLSKAFPDNKIVVCPSDFRIKQLSEEKFGEFIQQLEQARR